MRHLVGWFACFSISAAVVAVSPASLPQSRCQDGSDAVECVNLVQVGRRVAAAAPPMPAVGGYTPAQDAGEEQQALCDEFKDSAISQLNAGSPAKWQAVEFCTQVVAGINWFIKVDMGKSREFAYLVIYQDLDGTKELTDAAVGPGRTQCGSLPS
mmetsp:Transcript_60239/g.111690  ORF Transcript_60239/g.111690 Transcript_60239/m.111690 type:complete len:155 (+) Transcript_60239:107-571(+)